MTEFEDFSLIEMMINMLNTNEQTVNDVKTSAAVQIKDFIDRLPGGFLIYKADASEEIIYANKALLKLFRCDNFNEFKEHTGGSFRGIVYTEDLEAAESSIRDQITASREDLDYVEYRVCCKDGAIRWVEDYGHYIKTRSMGNVFYVFITDATEKITKRQKERLQRQEVIEGLSVSYDSILYVDLDTDRVLPYRLSKRLLKQFNRKMQAMSYAAVTDDFINCWVHPDDKQRLKDLLSPEHLRKALAETRTFYVNLKCIQDGEIKYLQLRIVDVRRGSRVSQIVIGSRDIDDETMQEMKQKTLLENALKDSKQAFIAKNAFLSNMSHDMRTPLNALFGYLELARKNLDDKAALEKYLDNVSDAGKQILDLVNKVLEISYIESKDFQLNESPCNLKTLTEEIYYELMPSAVKKQIDMSIEYRNVVHPEVYADRNKLKQILFNIAGNAVKYTGSEGKINLTVEERQSPSAEYATFRFIANDTGIGIAKESLEKIFEPFERENNSTHSGVFGGGLGLTIAKHIIDAMGGTITADSTVGVGSTFTITLSFRLVENEENAYDEKKVLSFLKGKKILLVEDNEINREIETEMLEDLGLVTDHAENGKIAVDKVRSSKPGKYLFVLMDIQMPVMDGRQATEEIRKLDNPALAGIPIIALSANAFESDKKLSVKTGMDAHLTKPIDIPLLLKTIAKTLKI